jgi:hypothetical protein
MTRIVALLALLLAPTVASAQGGIGIGPRLTFVRGSEDSPDGSQRLVGGLVRLGGGHTAVEIAMDYRAEVTGALTERVKSYPIQGSLLLYPIRARVAPYLLGGIGWYTQQVTHFSAPTGTIVVDEETTRKMGYHAGFGGEVRAAKHFTLFGDYRYTRINFGGGDDEGSSLLPGFIPGSDRLKLSHQGSMFTWGAVIYF